MAVKNINELNPWLFRELFGGAFLWTRKRLLFFGR